MKADETAVSSVNHSASMCCGKMKAWRRFVSLSTLKRRRQL